MKTFQLIAIILSLVFPKEHYGQNDTIIADLQEISDGFFIYELELDSPENDSLWIRIPTMGSESSYLFYEYEGENDIKRIISKNSSFGPKEEVYLNLKGLTPGKYNIGLGGCHIAGSIRIYIKE